MKPTTVSERVSIGIDANVKEVEASNAMNAI
jgi:hypothetical protein